MEKVTKESVLAYWNRKAEQLHTDPTATMKDVVLRSMEIEAICRRLQPNDSLLDIGAGNAYGSIIAAEHCASVVAMDYSPGMVREAEAAIAESSRSNVEARQGDILELSQHYGAEFNAISCVRVLINLGSEVEQMQAIREMAACLKPGGHLFLIEGVTERFEKMNTSRTGTGLSPIPLNWHNRLLREETLCATLSEFFEIEKVIDFGEYYFISRIVHPLLVAPEAPAFDGTLNKVARNIWQSGILRGHLGDLSTLVLYVARKTA